MEELVFELTLRCVVRINQASWRPGARSQGYSGERIVGVENEGKGPGQKQDGMFRNLQADQYLGVKGRVGDGTEEIKRGYSIKDLEAFLDLD